VVRHAARPVCSPSENAPYVPAVSSSSQDAHAA
jgi:hypothetical protein